MTRPRAQLAAPIIDCVRAYPEDYAQGVDSANRTIDTGPPLFVNHALELGAEQLEHWPVIQGKHSLTEGQYARTRGFVETLREYREGQAS